MKVLLIEDSMFQRIANERALTRSGYTAITARDGEDGLRIAREALPDLILLDMMLPKMSGLDVLRALKSDPSVKHIPVIVLTGLAQSNDVKIIKEGAAAFFMKSEKSLENDSAALIETVKSVLEGTKT